MDNISTTTRTILMSVAGGTASVLGGGKFANGALSSAFIFMFNDLAIQNTTAIKGWHQRIAVVDKDGTIKYAISFGLPNGVHSIKDVPNLFFGKGKVEIDKGIYSKTYDYISTTEKEDEYMIEYLKSIEGATTDYIITTYNCRTFAQEQFNYIKKVILNK